MRRSSSRSGCSARSPRRPGRVALRARHRRAAAAHVRRPALRRPRARARAARDPLRRRVPPGPRPGLPRRLARRRPARGRPPAGGVLLQPASRPALEAALLRHLPALLPRVPGALSQIRDFNPWNEPNHSSQPTFRHPKKAAGFYNAMRRACPPLHGRGRRRARLEPPGPLAAALPRAPARPPAAVVDAQLHRRQPPRSWRGSGTRTVLA